MLFLTHHSFFCKFQIILLSLPHKNHLIYWIVCVCIYIYIYIYIYIIYIYIYNQNFTLLLFHCWKLLLEGLLDDIKCPFRAVSFCWLANTGMFMWRGSLENITYEFVLASPAMSCMSCSSYLVLDIGRRWPYNCCFVKCCFQDLFCITYSILVQFLSSFCSVHFVSICRVHPYNWIDTTIAWKKFHFILLDTSDFHMIDHSPYLC